MMSPTDIKLTEEFYVSEWSKAKGKKFSDIEREFGIKIVHYHNSPISPDTRMHPTPESVVNPGIYLKVTGTWDKVSKFIEFADIQK